MARFRQRFYEQWKACGGSSSRAIYRLMLPWWIFTHVVQIPRKFVQFLPPLLVKHLLEFLQDPQVPVLVGYKLMLLAALRMICDKSAQALYLFSASNAGTQPTLFGCQTMILEKLQTISPRELHLPSTPLDLRLPDPVAATDQVHAFPSAPPRFKQFLRKWNASRPHLLPQDKHDC